MRVIKIDIVGLVVIVKDRDWRLETVILSIVYLEGEFLCCLRNDTTNAMFLLS